MDLNNTNYYTQEANMAYMSASQFKAFRKCEAAAMAELRGEYVPETTTALLVGSYVDAFVSGELEAFKAEHPEIMKRDGSLKADFLGAEEISKRIAFDGMMHRMLSGEHQAIRTGEIAGVPFKCKIDSLLTEEQVSAVVKEFPETADAFGLGFGAIVDLKVMRGMDPVWSDEAGRKVTFVEGWGYDTQGAIYQVLEGHALPFFLAVATKENPADLAVLSIGQSDLDAKFQEVEDLAPRYQAIKEGRIEPVRCEKCAYCRGTKRLRGIVDYKELI